ncbi:MAG: DUF3037 domain-containing protein [Kofleriaceae bacterium]
MRSAYDYAWLRVMPRLDDGQLVNVGVIVFARTRDFLGCALRPTARVEALLAAASRTLDVAAVQRHLEAVQAVCAGAPDAGPIARLPQPERFHWLTAPRSTMIQTSVVHSGLTADPAATLAHLEARLSSS